MAESFHPDKRFNERLREEIIKELEITPAAADRMYAPEMTIDSNPGVGHITLMFYIDREKAYALVDRCRAG